MDEKTWELVKVPLEKADEDIKYRLRTAVAQTIPGSHYLKEIHS